MKQWYVIHTFTGHENKVKTSIERRAASVGLNEKIGRILVLTEEELKGTRRGRRQVRTRKVFPGYVIMEAELEDDVRHLVRNTPGVTGFVGPDRQPVPLHAEEIQNILQQVGEEAEARVRVPWEVGDVVRILARPFEDFQGRIHEVNLTREKLKVSVELFGRETLVEVGFDDVEKIS
jgi:transcriptional antiterminator NusG